ncbi:hypothetical protein CAL12_12535 [Bordetella genomosp. 8]|uniref:Uncharacterized protein n=1 Tax=Bordetella genomosp. 8 TaxID=1416806 RepID=A0A1W6YKJ5_9BORD|nr:hypothetical protein [Bordetella genomosp. 8]ARP81551.1 hypothetical protein CAL12_12535 [Bordetella genomosp. 8]
MPHSFSPAAATPAYGFLPAFFEIEQRAAPPDAPREPGRAASRISYEPARDGSHQAFCDGPRFAQYRGEVRRNMEYIAATCRKLKMDDAAVMDMRFRQFYERRFEQAYFAAHAEILDGAVKRSFDNICALLADPRMRPENLAAAIRNLALGIGVCAPGVAGNVIEVEADLSLTLGGLRSRLWQAKNRVVRAVLQEAVTERYGTEPNFRGNQAHYVNQAWDHVADSVGLARVRDPLAPWMGSEFLASCRARVLAVLTPDRIASTIAQDLLSGFRSAVLEDAASSSGSCTSARTESFGAVVRGIRQELGLVDEQLSLHAFVRLDADGERYDVLDDPSLIAVDLLKAMAGLGLLAGVPVPVPSSEPVEQDGRYLERYHYGALVSWRLWRASAAAGAISWRDHDDVEAIDITDLRNWPGLEGPGLDWPSLDGPGLEGPGPDQPALERPGRGKPDLVLPPAAAVRRLLASDDPADLIRVQARWLGTAQDILALLRRLDLEQANLYLLRNIHYLRTELPRSEREPFAREALQSWEQGKAIAAAWYSETGLLNLLPREQAAQALQERLPYAIELPVNQRRRWMDEVMHLGEPAKVLARAWYRDPWTLLGEKNPDAGRTRLQQWLETNNAAAIDAVRELMTEDWAIDADRLVLGNAISQAFRGYDGSHLLRSVARATGSAGAAALHRLLRHLLSMPGLRELVAPSLPGLFHDPGGFRSDVTEIVLSRDASTLAALHRMLVDDAILPAIRHCMLAILAGTHPGSEKPMWLALCAGKAGIIKGYGALLADVVAGAPRIAAQLPRLLMPNVDTTATPGRHHGLVQASRIGAVAAIREYAAVLTHPAILPHVIESMPRFILGAPSTGIWSAERRASLALLFNPRLPGYAACVELAAHPQVFARVFEALPRDATIIRARLRQHAAAMAATAAAAGAPGNGPAARQAVPSRPDPAGSVRYWIDRVFQRF